VPLSGAREGRREGGNRKERGRVREGERKGERRREGGREGGRGRGREGERKRERRREGGREREKVGKGGRGRPNTRVINMAIRR